MTVPSSHPWPGRWSGTEHAAGERLRRIAVNASALSVAELSVRAGAYALVLLTSWFLGPDGLGTYSYVSTLAGLFAVFLDFGSTTYIVKSVAAQQISHVEAVEIATVYKTGVFALLGLPVCFVGVFGGSMPAQWLPIIIALSASWATALAQSLWALFQARQAMHLIAVAKVTQSLVAVALGSYALAHGFHVLGVFLASLSAATVAGAVTVISARRLGLLERGMVRDRHFEWRLAVKVAQACIPFGAILVLGNVNVSAGGLILYLLSGSVPAGLFNSAYRLIMVFQLVPSMIANAQLPWLAGARGAGASKWDMLNSTVRVSVLIALPLAGAVHVAAPQIIQVVYGDAFAAASDILRVMVWAVTLVAVSTHVWYFLMAGGFESEVAIMMGTLAVGTVALNLLVVPRWGAMGVALVTMMAEVFVLTYSLVLLRKCSGGSLEYLPLGRPIVSIVVGLALALVVPTGQWLASIILLELAYLVSLCALNGMHFVSQRQP